METYKLSQPIEFDGEKIIEISMDLDGLTVGMLERAEKQARFLLGKKENMQIPETNKKYLSCVAAKAAGVKLDLIRALSGKDFTQVCILVQNFLLDGDSDSEDWEEEPGNSEPENTEMKSSTPTVTENSTELGSTESPQDWTD